jgi:hypothetical protein
MRLVISLKIYNVPFVASPKSTAVMVYTGGCRRSMRQNCSTQGRDNKDILFRKKSLSELQRFHNWTGWCRGKSEASGCLDGVSRGGARRITWHWTGLANFYNLFLKITLKVDNKYPAVKVTCLCARKTIQTSHNLLSSSWHFLCLSSWT